VFPHRSAIRIRQREISPLVTAKNRYTVYIDAEVEWRGRYRGTVGRVHCARERWRGIVFQVAHALNCPTTSDSELALCLRKQDVDRLLHVKIHKPKYVPAYAPLIDRAVIPDKPLNLMENAQLFGGYEISDFFIEQCMT
jgi:hypothetical protein